MTNEELLEHLDIDRNNIIHFILANGSEMIGEFIDNSGDILDSLFIINPIKIDSYDTINDDNVVETQTILLPWTGLGEGPWTWLNTNGINTYNKVGDSALGTYLNAVYNYYYKNKDKPSAGFASESSDNILDDYDLTIDFSYNNVVSLNKWKESNNITT